MRKAIWIGIVAIIIIAVGGYLVLHKSPAYAPSQNSNQSTPSSSQTQSSTPSQAVAATITYTNSGFSPASITVKSGDTVAIKNASSNELQLDSNPHPVHTDDTDLNVGAVGQGQTVTFKVTKTGTYGYHNHLNPGDTGRITIQ